MSDAFFERRVLNQFVLRSIERGRNLRRIRAIMDERESADFVRFFINRSRLELSMNICTPIQIQAASVTQYHLVTINVPETRLEFYIFVAFKSGNFKCTILV